MCASLRLAAARPVRESSTRSFASTSCAHLQHWPSVTRIRCALCRMRVDGLRALVGELESEELQLGRLHPLHGERVGRLVPASVDGAYHDSGRMRRGRPAKGCGLISGRCLRGVTQTCPGRVLDVSREAGRESELCGRRAVAEPLRDERVCLVWREIEPLRQRREGERVEVRVRRDEVRAQACGAKYKV